MLYYLGPFQQFTDSGMTYYAPPVGTLGCIDLASLPDQSKVASSRPVCICWTSSAILPSEYTLVGDGDCRQLATTTAMQDAFQSLVGYRPQGATLANMVMDCLQGGSDPSGQNGPLPIVPTVEGWMDLWMPGHSRVLSERFEWGKPGSRGSNHTPKLQAMLRAEFAQLFADAHAGRLNDDKQHLRVLDYWCDKYNLQGADDWKQFVPTNLQSQVPGRVKHNTTINDSFNRTNATTLGTSSDGTWSWSAFVGASTQWGIVTNAAQSGPGTTGEGKQTAAIDLSSSDHYAQANTSIAFTGSFDNSVGAIVRKDGTATNTHYLGLNNRQVNQRRIFSCVAGTYSQLSANNTDAYADGLLLEMSANGSTLTLYYNGVQRITITNTAIAGNLRTGLYANIINSATGNDVIADNFQGADLSASSLIYTQLERNVRGMQRGMYQYNNGG